MILHHLTYSFRRLLKNRTYTLLNIFGLSVGLACFAMIGLWMKSELGYDRFHSKGSRIYRVAGRVTDEKTVIEQAITSPPLAAAMMKDFPEVENAVRIDVTDATVQFGDQRFIEDYLIVTDPSFFEVFDFKLLRGNPRTALSDPYSIVLTQSMATKYFADADPIGQSLRIFRYDPDGHGAEYKVTGIIEDCPANSQFQYQSLISFKTWEVVKPYILGPEGWEDNSMFTYVLLHPNADAAAVDSKFEKFAEAYLGKVMTQYKFKLQFFLQPLFDVHLKSNLRYEISPTSSMSYVIAFGTIGIIVLLLACINYVNLATAYSAERFKEVGIHKVMGAVKRQLVTRYLTESWMLAMISLLMSFVWIEVGRPMFESITGKPLEGLYTVQSIVTLLIIASAVGLFAGFYPALILSALRPASVLKGHVAGMSGSWLRKILVVFQYSITIVVVISVIVVQVQMRYIATKDLGYNHDNLVVIGVNGSREVMNGYETFANELMSGLNIDGVTRSNTAIIGGLGNSMATSIDKSGEKITSSVYRVMADHDYLDVYQMKLIAGRNFRVDNSADSTKAFIVNVATTKAYGYDDPTEAIGKPFDFDGREGQVIGVVGDFNFRGLQHRIEPTAIYLLGNGFSRISVRLKGNSREGFEQLATTWKKFFPNSVFDYHFYDEALQLQYRYENRFSKVFMTFSVISLMVACLGLFALVSYTVERRSKEIGIRKVLGATVNNILSMLSREFLLLVAISSVIAVPVGYYFMNEWLTGFAYHVSLNALMFVAAGALVLVVAWITVSLRTFRAASSNPVQSLRSE
ncbi:MAG: ABC transporter permease [Bacteroidota bacterium]